MLAMQLIGMAMLSLQNKRYFDELFHLGSTLLRERREDELRREDEADRRTKLLRAPSATSARALDGHGAPYLVTGCAGFLGSNLVGRMLEAGHEVVGVDNLSMGLPTTSRNSAATRASASSRPTSRTRPCSAVLDGPFEAVVHLAAFKIPRYGKAIDTLKINYRGTECALELARRLGCKLVLASTSDVYGRNPALPFSEEHTDHVIGNSKSPRWAYAVSKLFDEHLALAYQDAYGFPVTILRFFGSYGPKQPLSWWGGPPPVFIDCVLNDKPIPIHGDGSQTRSFTYVTDTVEGIYQATVRAEANGEIINIGNTQEITILELARRVKRLRARPAN